MKEKMMKNLKMTEEEKKEWKEAARDFKSPREWIKLAIFLLVCVVAYTMWVSHGITVANDRLILGLQTSVSEKYPDMTMKEAFDEFFNTSEWNGDVTEDGTRFIEFNGELYETNSTVCIQWQPTDDDAYFNITYFDVNGTPQNINTIDMIFDEIYTYAYNVKGYELPYDPSSTYNNSYDNLESIIDRALAPAYDELNRQMNDLVE